MTLRGPLVVRASSHRSSRPAGVFRWRLAVSCSHDRAGADPRQTCPTAEPSWYDGVGHTPHLEDPDRFNGELAALTRRVSS